MKKQKFQIVKNDEIDFSAIFKILFSSKKHIAGITALFLFIGIVSFFRSTPLFKSTMTMHSYSNKANSFSQIGGMANMLGIDIADNSPDINMLDFLHSRFLKENLIETKWKIKNENFDLIEYWGINQDQNIIYNPVKLIKSILLNNEKLDSLQIWQDVAINLLSERIFVKESKTGLVKIDVFMEDAQLAADISNKIYELLDMYTSRINNESATRNRKFIESRKEEINIELLSAEKELKEFRENNRSLASSPQLQLELERLLRKLEIKKQTFITLQQQYELARIEEIKEIPSVLVLDAGKSAIYKDSPILINYVVFSSFIGLFFGILLSLLKPLIK